MKKQWILILFTLLVLVGCKKSKLEESNNKSDVIESTANNPLHEEELMTEDTEKTKEMDAESVNLSYYANFIYMSYAGDTCSITFSSATDKQINFKIFVGDPDLIDGDVPIAENCIGTLDGDVVEFTFTDNYKNKGSGTLKFDGDYILLKTRITEKNLEAKYSVEVESRLDRQESYGSGSRDSSFIFSDSDNRYLNEEELVKLPIEDLSYARNEIYARHGYIFSNPKYASYFYNKSWYIHNLSPEFTDKPSNYLNDYEIQNIKLIKKIESQ